MFAVLFTKVFLVLIGPFVGSFLGVLMDRLARGEDVVRAPSSCRSCGVRLGIFDLIPILSFGLNRGRCRTCRAAIPPALLYSELLGAGAAVLAVIAGYDVASVLVYALFLWVLIALAGSDLMWFRLPDVLTGALALTTFAMAILPDGIGLQMAFFGALIGEGSFAILRLGYKYVRGSDGLGLGDVKLMIGLGAFVGPANIPVLVLIGASGALAVAIIQRRQNAEALNATRPLPFGAALCAAAAVIWVAQIAMN